MQRRLKGRMKRGDNDYISLWKLKRQIKKGETNGVSFICNRKRFRKISTASC